MKKFTRFFTVFLFTAALLTPFFTTSQAFAQTETSATMEVRAGFDGYAQEDAWIPVRVILENDGPEIDGEVRVTISGAGDSIYSAPVVLPTVSRKEISLLIAPRDYLRTLRIQLISGSKTLVSRSATLANAASQDMLIGVLAGNPSAYSLLNNLNPSTGRVIVAQLEAADIPENNQGLKALDVLVISDFDTGSLNQAQVEAIENWVTFGGRLLVTGGVGWQKTAAGIAHLLPFQPTGVSEIESLEELARFAPSVQAPSGVAVAAAGVPEEGALAIENRTGAPIAAWKQLGSGMVYYLAVDPAQEPLRSWDGTVNVFQHLLSISADMPSWAQGFGDWYQAEQATQTMPKLAMPSIFLICGFLVLYTLAVGPLNYYILIKLKKRELAWISIPLMVLFFSGCAIIIGMINRGGGPVLNRLALVHVAPGARIAKVDGLVGLYSPSRFTYTLELGGGLFPYPMSQNYNLQDQSWRFEQTGDKARISDMRVDVGEVRSFAVEGTVPAPVLSHNLELVYNKNNTLTLRGSVTNESDIGLEDAVILVPGTVRRLGDFNPGETKEIYMTLTRAERASSRSPNILASRTFTGPAPGYVYYYGGDQTITDIVGTSSYYDTVDNYRRFTLVSSAITTQSSGITGRGGGIYIAGWSDESAMEIEPVGNRSRRFETVDTTLFIIGLNPRLLSQGDEIVLPPPMFTWESFDSSYPVEFSPYSAYIDVSSRFSILFSLTQPVDVSKIKRLTVHLRSYTMKSPSGLSILLWDYTTGSYAQLPVTDWGDIDVEEPEKYVSPSGEIILRIEPNVSGLFGGGQLDRADLTLVVEP